jgi:hypothetical protein
VSGLLVQPLFTTAGPDVVREVGAYHIHGLDDMCAIKTRSFAHRPEFSLRPAGCW